MNQVEIQVATEYSSLPEKAMFQHWVDAALEAYKTDSEVLIRIVDENEIRQLNQKYRNKPGSTNILSFPFESPPGIKIDLLGDLVICAAIIENEAGQQQKKVFDHWAHIVVHGVLHLLGYDHIEDEDAEQMEAREIEILENLNITNPYLEASKT